MLCLSQQQMQATDIQEEEIKMNINLPYVKDSSEKLKRVIKTHMKIYFP